MKKNLALAYLSAFMLVQSGCQSLGQRGMHDESAGALEQTDLPPQSPLSDHLARAIEVQHGE